MKTILISLLFLISFHSLKSQYYIEKENDIGISFEQKVNLNDSALALINKFPVDLQDSFRVYSYHFYLPSEKFSENYEMYKNLCISNSDTKYYLIFCKVSNNNSLINNYIVLLNLPNWGEFSCIDLISSSLRSDLESNLNVIANNSLKIVADKTLNYCDAEIPVIRYLAKFVSKAIDCCDNDDIKGHSRLACTSCIQDPSQNIQTLKDNKFFLEFAYVDSDPDYEEISILSSGQNSNSRTSNLNISLNFGDGIPTDIDDFIDTLVSEQIADIYERYNYTPSVSRFIYKYPRDCGSFTEIYNNYNNSNSDFNIFISIINIDNNLCVYGYKLSTNLNFESIRSRSITAIDSLYFDEKEGIDSLYEDTPNVCGDLAYSFFNFWAASVYLSKDYFPWNDQKDLEYALANYDDAVDQLNESEYEFGIYFTKEYLILYQKYIVDGKSGLKYKERAREKAFWNLCGTTIHTILDLCGIDPIFFGDLCDATNAALYIKDGQFKDAALTTVGLIPFADFFKFGAKYSNKLLKPAINCVSSASPSCRSLQAIAMENGWVKWIGGRSKMLRLVKANNIKIIFNGTEITYDATKHELHHIIPWELCGPEVTQSPIMRRLAGVKWHASDPDLNGLILPLKFSNGTIFHANHPAYNRWIGDALSVIDSKIANNGLAGKMNQFSSLLKEKIEYAYIHNMSINDYFKTQPSFTIDMIQ